ncbi:MAG: isoprenylcysteine carboxylmethyltransferase family protein [Oscillatoriales cyanobacterium SM2_2_1]|nr:isoprenylcysteine carboxylmethyltransferase family protein [Oscillatoriales cyanobacterium SM2_2_1]
MAAWWQGKKGEYWVLGQGLVLAGFFLVPPINGVIPSNSRQYLLAGAVLLALVAVFFLIGGLWHLGRNLTPLPHPKDAGTLVTTGVYGLVRHPIYSGVICLCGAYGLVAGSIVHGVGTVGVGLFFVAKAGQEERWLREKFAEYAEYQASVGQLLPRLFRRSH